MGSITPTSAYNLSSTWELLREEHHGPLPLRSSRHSARSQRKGQKANAALLSTPGQMGKTQPPARILIVSLQKLISPARKRGLSSSTERQPGNWLLRGLAVLLLARAQRPNGIKELQSDFKKQAQKSKWQGNSTPGSLLQSLCAIFTPSFS